MSRTVFKSERIILPEGLFSGYITSENGKIISVGKTAPKEGELIDAGELYISPGFIDIHTHGAGGADFMDGDADCFITAANTHMRHGTTTMFPTSLACSKDELLTFLTNLVSAKAHLIDGPELAGAHLEGPYFNPQFAGAQDPRFITAPKPLEYMEIVEKARGAIARWSVAPELEGALGMGDFLFENGILPSIGHSAAEYTQVKKALDHHFTLVTHFYCAMSGIVRKNGYRHLGVIESVYALDCLDVEIIADGRHLPVELLGMIYKFLGPGRIALVTDAMRAAGMPEGESILGSLKSGQRVLVEDGVAKLPDRSAFAGSVATADLLVRVMHKEAGAGIVDATRMMTATPARIMGLQHRKGSIAVGLDCDLVIFDEDIRVKLVICKGKTVSENQ